MNNIIRNNYRVATFVNKYFKRYASRKFISEYEAKAICAELSRSSKGGMSYGVVQDLTIVGIVPMNKGLAYVFNKKPYSKNIESEASITAALYDDLIECYVFSKWSIDERQLNALVSEYKSRGGVVYEDYHSFEDLVIKEYRDLNKKEFRTQIVECIFKHGFREVRRKWTNGSISIRQVRWERFGMSHTHAKSHTELNVSFDTMTILGSIFGLYAVRYNQLSDNEFNVVCGIGDSWNYSYVYFNISFLA